MSHYLHNLRDVEFNLFEVLGREDVLGTGPFAEFDVETTRAMLREVARLAGEDLAPSLIEGDRTPPVYDPATYSVTVPDAFKKSYRAFVESGFWGIGLH